MLRESRLRQKNSLLIKKTCTLRYNEHFTKISFGQTVQKMHSFFFRELQLITLLLLIIYSHTS